MPTVFPNELVDRIIDHLHNDAVVLSACALVRSSWIPTVRYHRFRRVLLGPPASIHSFNALLQTSPDVAPYVSHLDILHNWSDDKNMAPLCTLLSTTPRLRGLHLGYMDLEPDKFRAICFALPTSLEHVELNHLYLRTGTLGDLVLLWSRLPRLRSFILIGDTKINGPEIPEEYTRSDTKLLSATELQLLWQIPHFDVIAGWFCSQNVPAQLRACSLSLSSTEYVAPIARLLRETGPALERFEFDLGSGEVVSGVSGLQVFYPCDLAQCTNLRELYLSGTAFGEHFDGSMLVLCMSHILAHVRAPGVRTLVFNITGHSPDVLRRSIAQLGSVATAISRNRAFDALERVMVRLCDVFGAPVSEDLYAPVRNSFKGFEERGLLTVRGAKLGGTAQWLN
ncbi:hypothetical protein GSI_04853 [Ganoderma sinense ZZ0214-1]|uniref:F-box domain-containing protein n=1 Tax=Ganoderma sinense ZZ0214-1 TaxID=1077348 RepID=A0A2G8SGQ0_9APHY|nr:hypothetical protein GSI_04853 [Ganoderma sinense ZZ0214-1]